MIVSGTPRPTRVTSHVIASVLEPDAAVRRRAAERAREPIRPMQGDLAGPALEFLQDLRAGTCGERERAAHLEREIHRLLDEEAARGSRRRRLPDDGREPTAHVAKVIGRHLPCGEVERETPRGGGEPRPVGTDPALVPVGTPREAHAHPGLTAGAQRTIEHGQDCPHAGERPAGADPFDLPRVPARVGPDGVGMLQDHQPLARGNRGGGGSPAQRRAAPPVATAMSAAAKVAAARAGCLTR